ncbi:MAG: thioredoxin domain-containing protein [Planctomycetota bacterium]
MKRLTKQSVLGLAVLCALAAGPVVVAEESASTPGATPGAAGPELVAVKFHADWCGSCKAMGDVFGDLSAKLDAEPVLFVELDLTTSADRQQAGYLMHAMDAGAVWNEHGAKTGFILLLDPADMSVRGKLTKEMGFKDMVKAIGEARAGA